MMPEGGAKKEWAETPFPESLPRLLGTSYPCNVIPVEKNLPASAPTAVGARLLWLRFVDRQRPAV
jgi:hypothetical protein